MRKSGILLHPTSLPGRFGIGDLSEWAYRFADFLSEGGQRLWQVLPLGPPGLGNSPYQAYSSMAGNPLLISLEDLSTLGLLSNSDFGDVPEFPESEVDFDSVVRFKSGLLRKAARRFLKSAPREMRDDFHQFCRERSYWLDGFAQFAALKEANHDAAWNAWEKGIEADPQTVSEHKIIQFLFFKQWERLKRYCNERGIQIIGDIPIFVAHDSADVWDNPDLFDLDSGGVSRTVAGVPPDYFSATGQCWGNPVYDWDAMERTGYRWWMDRIRSTLELVDIVRLDHFRGFEKYWAIPRHSKTAVNGRWLEGPGDRFFSAVEKTFGKLPFIAEDLGYITPEVHQLRDRWGFPGMRVLQFAFGNQDPSDPFKTYNFIPNCVVYTGTHDNDTTRGWFLNLEQGSNTLSSEQARAEREFALKYLNSSGEKIHWDFIRLAISSVAETSIYPLQDVLGLGSEARMNRPATAEHNWGWRFAPTQLKPALGERLRELCEIYGRA